MAQVSPSTLLLQTAHHDSDSCCHCIRSRIPDYVGSLNYDERVEYLVYGYIRMIAKDYMVPPEVFYFSRWYTGDSSHFHSRQLRSLKESGYGCCGRRTRCCICWRKLIVSPIRYWWSKMKKIARRIGRMTAHEWILILILAFRFFVNITALTEAITFTAESNLPIYDQDHVTLWLYIAAIVDIVSLLIYQVKHRSEGRSIGHVLLGYYQQPSCAFCCGKFIHVLFHWSWSVFGIILWTNMDQSQFPGLIVICWCIMGFVIAVKGSLDCPLVCLSVIG